MFIHDIYSIRKRKPSSTSVTYPIYWENVQLKKHMITPFPPPPPIEQNKKQKKPANVQGDSARWTGYELQTGQKIHNSQSSKYTSILYSFIFKFYTITY